MRPDPLVNTAAAATAAPLAGRTLVLCAAPAVIIPALLAFNLPPSATFLNQAAALIGWGGFALVLAHQRSRLQWGPGLLAVLGALVLLLLSVVGTSVFAGLPAGLAASAIGTLLAAALVVVVGAAAMQSGSGAAAFHAFCLALVAAGVLSVGVAGVQVFAPGWADGNWIAATALPGRASGNLRQPNHLSSLLLWSIIAALWLGQAGRLRQLVAAALAGLFVFALVLSGSRTGTVGVAILALWGALDRRLPGRTRVMLVLAPVVYAACWFGLTAWAHSGHAAIVDERRFSAEGDISSSRFGIWKNTLALIAAHPWWGVGWGEFNFAWSLTPFPGRPVAFFDHTHNLPLQFAVELGLPLATAVLALLTWALWRAFAVSRHASAAPAAAIAVDAGLLRAAFMMVLMIALHSQLEYPLWYAYFLLPTAFAFGLCVGADVAPAAAAGPAEPSAPRARPLVLASLLLMGGGGLCVLDYSRVVAIFTPGSNAAPLAERVASGQHSIFFAHHAAYASATSAVPTPDGFASATHYLLDTRLMIAWADALAASGDLDRARHLAQRLREFRNADAVPYFEPCDDPDADRPADEPLPYQCTPPSKAMDYRSFR